MEENQKVKYLTKLGEVKYKEKNSRNEFSVDENGFLHSYDDKPAHVGYDGKIIIYKAWYNHGYLNRIGECARIGYTKDGSKIMRKHYYIKGKRYKDIKSFRIIVKKGEELNFTDITEIFKLIRKYI